MYCSAFKEVSKVISRYSSQLRPFSSRSQSVKNFLVISLILARSRPAFSSSWWEDASSVLVTIPSWLISAFWKVLLAPSVRPSSLILEVRRTNKVTITGKMRFMFLILSLILIYQLYSLQPQPAHLSYMEKDLSNKRFNYQAYRKLTSKEKLKRIQDAKQSSQFLGPNPQGDCQFQQTNFVNFQVKQKNKLVKLCTYRHSCPPEVTPVALLIMLHGLNSHLGHGAHLAHKFAQHGIITVGFDHRGFGRSEGDPGYAQSFQTHLEDSVTFCQMMRFMYPKLPFFCLGLSMGGMTTYFLTLKYRYYFQGAILMAPALKNMVGGFLVGLTNTLASILPKRSKLVKPIYGKATRNPKITEDVKKDKFSFSERARLSTIQMLISTMQKAPSTFSEYKCPFMVVQGGLDKLVNPEGAFQLYDNSLTPEEDKQLLFYEGMWHDIWHEPEIDQITQKVVEWILFKRLKLKNQDKKSIVGTGSEKEIKQQPQINDIINHKDKTQLGQKEESQKNVVAENGIRKSQDSKEQ